MTDWQRVHDVFDMAVELDAPARHDLLDRECRQDADLRDQVEALLRAHAHADSFLETPAVDITDAALPPPSGIMLARQLGPYRVVRVLGEGGMGVVYLAERVDQTFERQVAVKVLTAGRYSRELLQRFQRERQILANLDHPHIVKLFDGGSTDEGLPYLVMDYVDGQTLDRYCDSRRLNVRERLQLFLQVCDAVQFAHRNLVIHRDLKHNNILVTHAGDVRLLDFGIAKMLSDDGPAALATQTDTGPMTLLFASPEQIEFAPLSTATDTYSLGVILYLLLTGRHPHHEYYGDAPQLKRAIVEDTPVLPSRRVAHEAVDKMVAQERSTTPQRLRRQLAGDLDRIVLMAIRKEPLRRYESVERLADDIQRHLSGLPVKARPDTVWYVTRKFVTRNVGVTIASVLVLLSILGGIITTSRQARRATQYAERAARQRDLSLRTLSDLVLGVQNKLALQPGTQELRAELLQTALAGFEDVIAESGSAEWNDRSLQLAYHRMADIHLTRGRLQESRRLYQIALEMAEEALREEPDSPERIDDVSRLLERLGDMAVAGKQLEEGGRYYQRSLELHQRHVALRPGNVDAVRWLAATWGRLGDVAIQQGDLDRASANYHEFLRMHENLRAENPEERAIQQTMATACSKMGLLNNSQGQLRDALRWFQQGVQIRAEAGEAEWADAYALNQIAGYSQIGMMQTALGEFDAAEQSYDQALSYANRLLQGDPQRADARRRQAVLDQRYAALAIARGNLDAADQFLVEAQRMFGELRSTDATWSQIQFDHILTMLQRGELALVRQQYELAEEQYSLVVTEFRQLDQAQQLESPVFRSLFEDAKTTLSAIQGWRASISEADLQEAAPSLALRWMMWRLRRDRESLSTSDRLVQIAQARNLIPGLSSAEEQGAAYLGVAAEYAVLAAERDAPPEASESALECLQEMLKLDSSNVSNMMVTPDLASLRQDPRFQQMFEDIVRLR